MSIRSRPSAEGLLALAREAAGAAGTILLERFGGRQEAVQTKSSATDLVGEADLAAERAVRALLAERRPEDGVLGEEGGDAEGASGLRWVLDPLDGTTNYLYGIGQWAVSIACEDESGPLLGVVLDAVRGEEWAALRGGRAVLNGAALPARGEAPPLAEALVGTGFGYAVEARARQAEVLAQVLPRVRDIRRGGSAALDLAWTAAGRLDLYFERGLQPWDEAAGALICRAAGLETRRLEPTPHDAIGLVAGPSALVPALYELAVTAPGGARPPARS